jgi:bilirubin oxidase
MMGVFKLQQVLTCVLLAQAALSAKVEKRKSPQYQHSFQLPLVIPSIKEPLATFTNPESGTPIDFYTLEVSESKHSFYPNLENATVIGFDGTFMGPTFRVQKGHESVIRLINKSNKPTNLHLHGSFTRSPFDGWAMDILKEGEFKDYYYPNSINSRSLWYHDHAMNYNAINIYRGMFGMYQITDPKFDKEMGIPHGGKYDVPLAFTAQFFTEKGDLTDESKEKNSIWGDTWVVNGRIHPFLDVEPRKYRFRVLNGAVSRGLNISIEANDSPVAFHVIGSDGGLRQTPAETKSLVTGMGERWEIVVDFTPFKNQKLMIKTHNTFADTAFEGMDKAMQFRVGESVGSQEGNGDLPNAFKVNLKFPEDRVAATREFKLMSHMDTMWGINSYHMDDPMKRVMMRPPLGTIEKIKFLSGGMSMSGMSGMMGGSKSSGSSSSSSSSNSGGHMGSSTSSSTSSSSSGMMGSTSSTGMSGHNSHHGGGGSTNMGMNMKKRQINSMSGMNMDMNSMGGGSAEPDYWSHSMHLHLTVSQVFIICEQSS